MFKSAFQAPPSYSQVPTTDPDHPLSGLSARAPDADHHGDLLSSAPTLDVNGPVPPFDESFDPTPANDREAALVSYHAARREQELREPPKTMWKWSGTSLAEKIVCCFVIFPAASLVVIVPLLILSIFVWMVVSASRG
jgi:hypothetical protein